MGGFSILRSSSNTYVDVDVNISRTSDHDVHAGKARKVLEMVAQHVFCRERHGLWIRVCSIKVNCTSCSMLALLWDT
jgi:hypothetical protein